MAKRQIGLALDDEMRVLLDRAAEANFVPLAEEIRARLARTFEEGEVDQETRQLISAIRELVKDVDNYGFDEKTTWNNNSKLHAALVAAITAYLDVVKPNPAHDDPVANKFLDGEEGDVFSPSLSGRNAAHRLLRRWAAEGIRLHKPRPPLPTRIKPKK